MSDLNLIFTELIRCYPALGICLDSIQNAASMMCECYSAQGKVLVCGNGGSGADSEHIVGELMKEFYIKRPLKSDEKQALIHAGADGGLLAEHIQGALPAIPLTGGIALSTAYANDAVPEMVFAQQVWGYGRSGDILIAISTSGNSANVLYAIQTARARGMQVIGLTGEDGGKMGGLCDECIKAPASATYRVQEYHLPIYHALCRYTEAVMFGQDE